MKRIWLIRHGQSMSQIDSTVSGINPLLSPLGEEQARNLPARLEGMYPDVVFISPLIRACKTFQLSRLQGKEMSFNKCLVESNWGRDSLYGDIPFDALKDIATLDPSSNHLLDVKERAAILLDQIAESPAESFVLFGHWGVFSEIFKCFFAIEAPNPCRAVNENTAISQLSIGDDGTRQLEFWNDHNHVIGLE